MLSGSDSDGGLWDMKPNAIEQIADHYSANRTPYLKTKNMTIQDVGVGLCNKRDSKYKREGWHEDAYITMRDHSIWLHTAQREWTRWEPLAYDLAVNDWEEVSP